MSGKKGRNTIRPLNISLRPSVAKGATEPIFLLLPADWEKLGECLTTLVLQVETAVSASKLVNPNPTQLDAELLHYAAQIRQGAHAATALCTKYGLIDAIASMGQGQNDANSQVIAGRKIPRRQVDNLTLPTPIRASFGEEGGDGTP